MAATVLVTLYDGAFAARGIAMLASLAAASPGLAAGAARMVVFALDDAAADATRRAGATWPWLSIAGLGELAALAPGLEELRRSRGAAAFCWTLAPLSLQHALAGGAGQAVYVDADLWFHADPLPALARLATTPASVHITPHGFPPWADRSAEVGRFCVQFLPVRNDDAGRAIVERWSAQCLAACPDRASPGVRVGDQGYLDEWPAQHGTAVAAWDEPGIGCGPWNRCLHRLRRRDGRLAVARGDGPWAPLLFFHHQDVKHGPDGIADLARLLSWPMAAGWLRHVTLPYLVTVAALHRRWLAGRRPRPAARPPPGFWPRWVRDRLTRRGEATA